MQKPRLSEPEVVIERLNAGHARLLERFSCADEGETNFLRFDALPQQGIRLNESFLLFENEAREKIVSFITFSVGSFILSPEREIFGVKIRDKPYEFPSRAPCMLIAQLATDKGEEGRGGASLLIDFAARVARKRSQVMPFPFLAVHAFPDKVGFYEKQGFEKAFTPVKGEPQTVCMYVSLL